MVFIIRLSVNGNIDEENIYTKKNEIFDLDKFKDKINMEDSDFVELYKWSLEKKKVLKLFGKNTGDKKQENIHKLPISNQDYNYFSDLFLCLLDNEKYISLDIEIFENIYNALYLTAIDEENDISEEEEEDAIFSDNSIISEEDEEEFNIDNYGDNSENEASEDEEEKKPVKKVKRINKLIKVKEVDNKDILYEEKETVELKNDIRIKSLKLLLTLVPKNKFDDYFKNLEREIFNHTINNCVEKNIVPCWNHIFTKLYINKARTIYTNLNPESYIKNKRLMLRLKKNEFTPYQLVNMNYQELFPENWKELIDMKFKKDKVLYESKKEAMTDKFVCKRCGSRETCYYEVQTRSADEPMTIFITCLNCGNRWKI
uniref:Transcription factor S-II n=1 Tax=Mimiviridae sp. ChoanoV1 TaxID=2596887 RepID=A0A5B8HXC3_9VIRU|nr:transcription factor S-II [Mimiviridae sp. ChoanoV1]